jgi:hypothetical protein
MLRSDKVGEHHIDNACYLARSVHGRRADLGWQGLEGRQAANHTWPPEGSGEHISIGFHTIVLSSSKHKCWLHVPTSRVTRTWIHLAIV